MVLGQAAAEADHERPGELEEAAAAEMELGGQALRAMWRWTCHQVWSLHARCECPGCTLLPMPCSAHQEAKVRQGITSLARPFGTLQRQLICPISGSAGVTVLSTATCACLSLEPAQPSAPSARTMQLWPGCLHAFSSAIKALARL